MPVISYTSEIAKKLKPGKGQTIRPAGKRQYKVGDRLYHYTGPYKRGKRIKLGESTVCEVTLITLEHKPYESKLLRISGDRSRFISYNEFARKDGFNDFKEMEKFFIETYNIKYGNFKNFNIIKWDDFVQEEPLNLVLDEDSEGNL